jgi:hypothetical protein
MDSSPLEYAKHALPFLMSRGILRESDFSTKPNTLQARKYGESKKRRFNPKSPAYSFSSDPDRPGSGILYYLGRGKIVGTETPIDYSTMSLVRIDPETAAVIDEKENGQERILYTFSLLSSDEVALKRDAVVKKFQDKGQNLEKTSHVSSRSSVPAEEMRRRIRKYDVTDHVPPRTDESPIEYGRRIAMLEDYTFVSTRFNSFFREAGLGTKKLPWSEQLVLASVTMREKEKGKLLSFAKQYGIEGLRTFLAADYDHKIGGGILELERGGILKPLRRFFASSPNCLTHPGR